MGEESLVWQSLLAAKALAPTALLPLLTKNTGGRPPLSNDPEELLESPKRRAIYEAIKAEPGVSVGELATRPSVNMAAGTFFPHLHLLVGAGLVETRQVGRKTLAYPAGMAPKDDALLAIDSIRRVAEVLVRDGPHDSRQIMEKTGLGERIVQHNLKRLRKAGYVLSEGSRKVPTYVATPRLNAVFT